MDCMSLWQSERRKAMDFVCCFLSIFCMVYYVLILIYSGPGTSFCGIWLILSFCLGLASVVLRFYDRFREKVPLRLEVAVVTAAAALFAVFLAVEVIIGVNFFSLEKQSTDYVIVLGAQVQGTELSRSLKYRVEKALEYARVHSNTILILSGGQGEGEDISEADAMYNYLREHGIPEYQMIKEDNSHSTYENLAYSKALIDEREKSRRDWIREVMASSGYLVPPDDEVTIRVGIVTSNFHVLRAKGIAKRLGIQDPTGIASKSDPVLFLHFCVRECFAILKDKFVGNM